jgi:hypothetical protein
MRITLLLSLRIKIAIEEMYTRIAGGLRYFAHSPLDQKLIETEMLREYT